MTDLPQYQTPLPIVADDDIEEAIKAKSLSRAIRQTVRSLEYLHRPVENDPGTCIECWQQMPCSTRRALIELKLAAGIEGDIQGAEEDDLTPEQRLLKAIFEKSDLEDDNFDPEFDYLVSREDYGKEDPIPGLEPPPHPGTWDGVDWRDYEGGTD